MPPQTPPTDSPKEYFEQAKRLLDQGDVWGALARAGTLRQHLAEEAPILALNGFVLARIGAHMPAIADLRRALSMTERALEEGEEENPARPRIVDQKIRLRVQIARSMAALGEPDEALSMLDDTLEFDPDRADTVSVRARVLAQLGRADEALESIDKALAAHLDETELYTVMGEILADQIEPDPERLERCSEKLDDLSSRVGVPAADLMMTLRVLARLNDRAEKHNEAFRAARRAAKLRPGNYNAQVHAQATAKVIEEWTADEIARLVRPEGQPGASRVVLAGTVHSGMGRMEEILTAMPDAISIGPAELVGSMCSALFKCAKAPLRAIVPTPKGIRGDQLDKLAQGYTNQSDRIAGVPGMVTVDTHPHNTILLGALGAALSGLTIINCRRDPVEETLAIFCDEMPGNHGYAGDLVNAAAFVRDSHRLMDHWARVLTDERIGVKVIDVEYTRMMDEPGAVLKEVAQAIGVECDEESADSLTPKARHSIGDHASAYERHLRDVHELFGSEKA